MLASAAATVSSGKYLLTACSAASPTLAAAEEKAFAPAITNGPMKGSNCGGFARDILKRSAASDEAPNEAASRAGAACSATSAAWWTVSKGSAEASWNTAKQEPGPVLGSVKKKFDPKVLHQVQSMIGAEPGPGSPALGKLVRRGAPASQ